MFGTGVYALVPGHEERDSNMTQAALPALPVFLMSGGYQNARYKQALVIIGPRYKGSTTVLIKYCLVLGGISLLRMREMVSAAALKNSSCYRIPYGT